ncbi:hypothetical protein Mgra_00004212 [Meloidogyne graminicola]|uniref:Uncharacterized protein n=1 Tax=Meloidogyne graminicola TaxID=189291 RepID=A0A8S9ZTC2_9BILA|nr:hypothetical protein Mgra_00004212 [Meloidogyne graminicola]
MYRTPILTENAYHQHIQMVHHFLFFLALLVIPFILINCCGSKKKEGNGSKKSSKTSNQSVSKKKSSEKLSLKKKSSSETVEKQRIPSKIENKKQPSVFKSKFDGVKTALKMDPGIKKSSYQVKGLGGMDDTTAKSISKPTTKSSAFSKSDVIEAPSDMKSKVQEKVKGGISQRRFKTVEEKIIATKKFLAYTGRKGPPSGNPMGNLDKQIESEADGHLAITFSPRHIFDTHAYRYSARPPKPGNVARINEAGNLLYLCDDVSKTRSASSSSTSKKKEIEVPKAETNNTAEDAHDIKKDEVDLNDVKDEDEEETTE